MEHTEEYINDEYEQALKRGDKGYADAYIEGLKDGLKPNAELLEALKDVDKFFDETELVENTNESRKVWDIIKQAIKKATQ